MWEVIDANDVRNLWTPALNTVMKSKWYVLALSLVFTSIIKLLPQAKLTTIYNKNTLSSFQFPQPKI